MSKEQELAAKDFAFYWYKRGDELSEMYEFWCDLLRDVFGIKRTTGFIKFNQPIEETTLRMDAVIPETKVLIEQKSFDVDLSKKLPQSDGELLTPLEQAKRYADLLPDDKKPRWIVTCNFSEFRIYQRKDNRFATEPTVIKLRDLRWQFPRLEFLINPSADTTPPEEKISRDAAKIIHAICLDFDKKYFKCKPAFRNLLSKICTRLVFCFYADDAGIFVEKKFGDWFKKVSTENLSAALEKFFDVLNTPLDKRPENLDDDLKKFPYVDGGLFDEKLTVPPLNKDLKTTIELAHFIDRHNLIKFSWREISPPIFGAMFESIFSLVAKQEGGMYYTSLDNIHKVIDPLFLDDLRDEFETIKRQHLYNRRRNLLELQDKIASLKFLDPACGSGNFLTETYCCLRRLENEIIEALHKLYVPLPENPVKVSINQFYGIEINQFAVAVTQTALWIAENQMLQETEGVLGKDLNALPLQNYATIVCNNANQVDWKEIAPNVDYIIGNPPFRGYSEQTSEQKADMRRIFADNPNAGKIDYVAAWYQKAAEFIQGTQTRCAFVSTNSIMQGEQVAYVWKNIFERLNVHIDFAHRTFKWLSDSDDVAQVHCVVVGFSVAKNKKPKKIFEGTTFTVAKNINAYLVDGENLFLTSRRKHFQDDVPKMITGNRPADGGNLIIEADDLDYFLQREPAASKFIKPLIGADEFIDGKPRYCLWLVNVPTELWKKLPLVAERVELCRQDRLQGADDRKKLAETPQLFRETRTPASCLVVPETSSENRRYVPMGFINANVITANSVHMIPDATTYDFGVLTSSIHMAWMRTVCGRLKSDYRYSAQIVYNNFPWPSPSPAQKRLIEESAQKILDVRKKFPSRSFASLYDEETMPDELRAAHHANDYNVALAYGFQNFLNDEARVVAELMKLYAELTK